MATNRQRQIINPADLALFGIVILAMYAFCRMIMKLIVALVQEIYLLGKWIYLSTKQCIAAKKAKQLEKELNQKKLPPHDSQA